MYTRQQISLIESIPEQHLFNLEMNELVTLMYELEIEYRYQYLVNVSLNRHYYIKHT